MDMGICNYSRINGDQSGKSSQDQGDSHFS